MSPRYGCTIWDVLSTSVRRTERDMNPPELILRADEGQVWELELSIK